MLLIKGAREGAYRGSGSEKKFVKCPYPPYNKKKMRACRFYPQAQKIQGLV